MRAKVVHVMASPLGVKGVLRGQLGFLRASGFDVTVISSPGSGVEAFLDQEGADFVPLAMEREISPRRDLVALWRLWKQFRRLRPDISHVGMPKGGLLGGLAAWLAGVPHRVYTLHGLRLDSTRGWRRHLLTFTERIACLSAHRVVCVSESLRRRAIQLRLVSARRTVVLGSGSANGIDLARFESTEERRESAREKREELGIPQDAPLVGFVGRLTRDKGVTDLVGAFERLKHAYPELRLLFLGPFETGDPIPSFTRGMIEMDRRILAPGSVDDTAPYYHLIDILALPSRREGLPAVALEAAAAGKPVVGSRATGIVDAVADGQTGLLVPVGDIPALSEALSKLLDDPALARRLGAAGHQNVKAKFDRRLLWDSIAVLYRGLLSHGQPAGAPSPGTPARVQRVSGSSTSGGVA